MPKKTLIITILAIAVIGLAAVTGYFLQKQAGEEMKRQEGIATMPSAPEKPLVQPSETPPITEVTPQPETPTTTEPIDTSDWKTYRDEEYGFELKYPEGPLPEWAEGRIWREDVELPYLKSIVILLPLWTPKNIGSGGEIYLKVKVAENPEKLTLKEWISRFVGPQYEGEKFASDKLQGIRVKYVFVGAPAAGGCDTFYFNGDSKIYSIAFCQYEAWQLESLDEQQRNEVFKREEERRKLIVSSFKIIHIKEY
jgi:hypothetical protein